VAFSVTGLQLVNRVRRRRRLDDVLSIAAVEDLAALDSINNAIEEVLSSERWEFDIRRAQIVLKGAITGGTIDVANRYSQTIDYTNTDGIDNFDDFSTSQDGTSQYIIRVLPTGSDTYGSTGFRLLYSGGAGPTTTVFGVAPNFPVEVSAVEATLFYSEYILPDTVRDVVRVTYQQEPLTLEQIDPIVEFDELHPGPGVDFGPPETVSVGGLDAYTYLYSNGEPDPSLRMIVWPVPDDEYVLDYTYYYRHPELTTATSTLDGVPQNIVAKIVDLAAVQMKTFYEKDYASMVLAGDTRRSLGDMHRRSKGQSADRKIMGNWEGSGARHTRYGNGIGSRIIGGA
jgi:hypothetical protein